MKVKYGVPVPLTWIAPNAAATKVVKAQVYDGNNVAVGSPVAMPHVALGMYAAAGPAMPGTLYARVVYEIFQADGTTPSTDTDQRALDVVELSLDVNLDSLTGFLDSHTMMPVRDTVQIVRGESKAIPVTLLKSRDSFTPIDISAATEIVATMINQDQTMLTKTLSASQVQIVSGPAGQITVNLSSADTTNMRLSERQNMQVAVTIGGQVSIVPIMGKVNVIDTVTLT